MILRTRGVETLGSIRTSSRYIGYTPLAMVFALMLATPMTWRRRGWCVVWGLVFAQAFIICRLTLTLAATGFAADKAYAVLAPGPFWFGVLTRVESLVSDNPTVSFVVPVLIWLTVLLLVPRRDGEGKVEGDRAGGSRASDE